MKNIKLYFASVISFIAFCAHAQTRSFEGTWQGTLNVGISLRFVFHIHQTPNEIMATADSPDQAAFGLKCDTAYMDNGKLHVEMRQLRAFYVGVLKNDSTLEGTFTQANTPIPLTLIKTKAVITGPNRPQTPKPPFPYQSIDVEYDNADRSIHYGATITMPQGKGPFPAILMITGSGPQNRDEEIFGHKPFAVIADYLTRKGYLVMRVDDRGVGKTTGNFENSTSADFAEDANTSFNYLLSRSETDKKHAGLIGHSEGGMIAPMLAAKRKDIDFIILLAGPGVKIIDLMVTQNQKLSQSEAVNNDALNAYLPMYRRAAMQISNAKDSTQAYGLALKTVKQWMDTVKPAYKVELNTTGSPEDIAKSLVRGLYNPWYRYFLNVDPQVYLENITCKVLALDGDRDIQVDARQNLTGIESSLKKGNTKNYTIKEMPGLNHLFQTCKQCTVPEYRDLEETFSPEVLQIMADWLNKNVHD